MSDTRVTKCNERLWQELFNELHNLRIACEQWELDNFEQSTVIAKSLRVLLYDHGTSRSLFAQLNLKSSPFFATPALVKIPNAKQPGAVLAKFAGSGWVGPSTADTSTTGRWAPQYYFAGIRDIGDKSSRMVPRRLPFIQWWTESVLWNESDRISREEIVLALCNELGGTHAAARLTLKTAKLLSNEQAIGGGTIAVSIGGKPVLPMNTNYDGVVRQIAYEVQRTVQKNFQKQIENTSVVPPLPDGWRIDDNAHGVQVRIDDQYLREVLIDLERAGHGDTIGAEDIRSEIYWRDYAKKIRKIGIF
jgi:hypothetical protein